MHPNAKTTRALPEFSQVLLAARKKSRPAKKLREHFVEFGALVRLWVLLWDYCGNIAKQTRATMKGKSYLPRLFSLQPRVERTRTLGKVHDLLITIIKVLVIP